MVPEVDKKDTHKLLTHTRELLEASRLEILRIPLSRELTKNDAEAQAVRKLAARSAQQARQWNGKMLAELGSAYPYPNSLNTANQKIDATTVSAGLKPIYDVTVTPIQRIKAVRVLLRELDDDLEILLGTCIPGSRFNMFLFEVQKQALQASMWLGELLHECEEPKIEAPVSGNTPAPTTSEAVFLAATDSGSGADSSPALPTRAPEPASSTPSPSSTSSEPELSEAEAADLAKIQADSEPGDQFKANLERGLSLNDLDAVIEGVKENITPETATAIVEANQHIPEFAEAVAQVNSETDSLSPNGNVVKKSAAKDKGGKTSK